MTRGYEANTAYLYEPMTEQGYRRAPSDGVHVMRRGSTLQAAQLARAVIANHGDQPNTAHDIAAGSPSAALPERVRSLLDRRAAAVQRRQATYQIWQTEVERAREGHPLAGDTIHHSDAGSQYSAVHFTETLMLAGLIPSVGTAGDALDNALAETTIGLYKTECTGDGSPFRSGPLRRLADLEDITSAWVHWYNTSRLMHRLGRRPPAEAEAKYYAHRQVRRHTDHLS